MSEKNEEYQKSEFPEVYSVTGLEPDKVSLQIFIEEKALFGIDEFLKSDTSIELGGVLTGNVYTNSSGVDFILIKNFIIAKHSSSTLSRLTFTHETWEFINNKIEKDHPEQKILGWFHSHPGHSVFLSGYDLFIQENFFNLPYMIAYVFDPIIDDKGFFYWENETIKKAVGFYTYSNENKTDKKKLPTETFLNSAQSSNIMNNNTDKAQENKKVNRNVLLFTMFLFNLLMTFWLYVKVNRLEELKSENNEIKDRLEQLKIENGRLTTKLDNFISQLENNPSGNKNTGNTVQYIVKEGDTIKKIAMIFYKDESKAQMILKLNNMQNESDIKPGQVLQIPKLTE